MLHLESKHGMKTHTLLVCRAGFSSVLQCRPEYTAKVSTSATGVIGVAPAAHHGLADRIKPLSLAQTSASPLLCAHQPQTLAPPPACH